MGIRGAIDRARGHFGALGPAAPASAQRAALPWPTISGLRFRHGFSLPGCLLVGLGLRLPGRIGGLASFALAALEVVICFACRDIHSRFSAATNAPSRTLVMFHGEFQMRPAHFLLPDLSERARRVAAMLVFSTSSLASLRHRSKRAGSSVPCAMAARTAHPGSS
jgi:hypothetical protein